jgi:hypothetical protein
MVEIYEHHSNTKLLDTLRRGVADLSNRFHYKQNVKVKLVIKELKRRTLTDIQKQTFRRLVDRYSWI